MNQNPYAMPLSELKREMTAGAAPSTEAAQGVQEFERFQKLCPDFRGTPEDAEALVRYLPEEMGLFPTAEELRDAHVQAWYRGEYQTHAPGQRIDTNPDTMPLHQLRSLANGEPPLPEEYGMEMTQLRDAALGIERGDQDPAWKMPMGELKTAMQKTGDETNEQ